VGKGVRGKMEELEKVGFLWIFSSFFGILSIFWDFFGHREHRGIELPTSNFQRSTSNMEARQSREVVFLLDFCFRGNGAFRHEGSLRGKKIKRENK
jgi:hypothetical protein